MIVRQGDATSATIAAMTLESSHVSPAGTGYPTEPARISDTAYKVITPAGGQSGGTEEWFTTHVGYTGLPSNIAAFCGTSEAIWLGSHPYYATGIVLRNVWHVDGIVFGFSFLPGLDIHADGRNIEWDLPVPNTYAVYEDFSSCSIPFSGILYSAAETVTAQYQSGNHFYLEGPASDSATI